MESTTLMKNITVHEIYNKTSKTEYRHIEIPMNLSIVFLLSLSRIILLIVISVLCTKRRSLTRIITVNLALSDLLFTVGPIFRVYDHIWGSTLGGMVCKFYSLYIAIGFYSSMAFLVLLSVERYITVVHPHSDWKNEFPARDVLVYVWVMSILVALPVMVNINAQSYPGGCRYSKEIPYVITMYKELFLFVSAFLVMSFCFIKILQTIYKSTGIQKRRTTGLAFVLVATFFICWAPYNTLNLLYILDYHQIRSYTHEKHLINTTYICFILALTRICLNPLIYGLFGLESGETVQKISQRRPSSNPAEREIAYIGLHYRQENRTVAPRNPPTNKGNFRKVPPKRSRKKCWCI